MKAPRRGGTPPPGREDRGLAAPFRWGSRRTPARRAGRCGQTLTGSSERTRELLPWEPTGPTLIEW